METDRLVVIWLSIIAGALLVATGGLLATWGWQRLAAQNQIRNLVSGIRTEIRINEMFRERQPRLFNPNEDSALFHEGMMPRLRNAATKAGLSSGLLGQFKGSQCDLNTDLLNYEWSIDALNRFLEIIESERIRTGGKPVAQSMLHMILESRVYLGYLEAENRLKGALAELAE